MGFINDDRDPAIPVLAPDIIQDEWKFLDGRDDNLLATLDKVAQVARVLGVADSRADLCELLDRVADLLIEDAAGCHHDDRAERRCIAFMEADELMGEPSDRIRFAAARRMLD